MRTFWYGPNRMRYPVNRLPLISDESRPLISSLNFCVRTSDFYKFDAIIQFVPPAVELVSIMPSQFDLENSQERVFQF